MRSPVQYDITACRLRSLDVYTHQEIKHGIHGQKYDMELVAKVGPYTDVKGVEGEALCWLKPGHVSSQAVIQTHSELYVGTAANTKPSKWARTLWMYHTCSAGKVLRFFEGTTQRADMVTIAIHVPNLAVRIANFEGCQLEAVSLTHQRLALMNGNAAKATVLTMYMWEGVFH